MGWGLPPHIAYGSETIVLSGQLGRRYPVMRLTIARSPSAVGNGAVEVSVARSHHYVLLLVAFILLLAAVGPFVFSLRLGTLVWALGFGTASFAFVGRAIEALDRLSHEVTALLNEFLQQGQGGGGTSHNSM